MICSMRRTNVPQYFDQTIFEGCSSLSELPFENSNLSKYEIKENVLFQELEIRYTRQELSYDTVTNNFQ